MTTTRINNSQKGGALIYVLWVAMILSTLLMSMIATSRSELRTLRSQIDRFKLSVAMDAASEVAAYRTSTEVGFIDNIAHQIPFEIDGHVFVIEPYTPYAPIDINISTEAELARFFGFLGQDKSSSDRLAAQIADWRDADDLSRFNGAESRDYRGDGSSKRIENRQFISVEELRLVKDISNDLFECARPAMSVVSGVGSPGPLLLKSIYGRTGTYIYKSAKPRIGTSSHAPRGGEVIGFSIKGTKKGEPYPKLRRVYIYRMIGRTTSPYKLTTTFSNPEMPSVQPLCATQNLPEQDLPATQL